MESQDVAGQRWVLRAAGICLLLAACSHAPVIKDYREARAISDQGLALMEAGDNAGAVKLLDQAIAYNGGEISDLTRRATAYAALHQDNAALRDLDRAIERDPSKWRSYLLRAITYQDLGQFDSALTDLDSAIALQPYESELLRRRGYLRLVSGDFAAAVLDYESLIALKPTSGIGPFGRGVALYLSGDWKGSAEEFDRQLHAAPADGIAALWLAKSLLKARVPVAWEQFAAQSGPEPEWMMARLLLTETSVDEVMHEIARLRDSNTTQRIVGDCEAVLFFGAWNIVNAHDAVARDQFNAALQACPQDSVERAEARTALVWVQRTHN